MSSENGKHIDRQIIQKYEASPSVVFPLLCPVKEAEWLDGWVYSLKYSKSGFAEEGCIFTTQFPGEEVESIWIWAKHDPKKYEVQFYRIVPGILVHQATIRLEDDYKGGSNAYLTYAYTILDENAASTAESMVNIEITMIDWMEKSINHYVKTGEKLLISNAPIK